MRINDRQAVKAEVRRRLGGNVKLAQTAAIEFGGEDFPVGMIAVRSKNYEPLNKDGYPASDCDYWETGVCVLARYRGRFHSFFQPVDVFCMKLKTDREPCWLGQDPGRRYLPVSAEFFREVSPGKKYYAFIRGQGISRSYLYLGERRIPSGIMVYSTCPCPAKGIRDILELQDKFSSDKVIFSRKFESADFANNPNQALIWK